MRTDYRLQPACCESTRNAVNRMPAASLMRSGSKRERHRSHAISAGDKVCCLDSLICGQSSGSSTAMRHGSNVQVQSWREAARTLPQMTRYLVPFFRVLAL